MSQFEFSPKLEIRLRHALMAALAVCACASAVPVHASGHGEPAGPSGKEHAKSEHQRHIYDLGTFELREVQTSRKKTIEMNFSVYFRLAPDLSDQEVEELEHWKNRLRDQVIIAVRTARNLDFQEPDLERVRRIIMFRVRRLLNKDVVQDVLLSKFTFKTE